MVNILLLLPYTVLLRIHSLIHPVAYSPTTLDTPLSKWFFDLVSLPLVQSIIAILLVFGQAIFINLLANNHRLHRLPSALAGMCYVLIVSAIPEFMYLTPALLGTSFILIAIFSVFNTYKLSNAAKSIFNAAICSSAAALIYPPFLFAVLAIFIGLAMMRNFRMIERIQFMLGFGVLVWIVAAFFFFFDLFSIDFFSMISVRKAITQYSWSNLVLMIPLGIIGLLVLISLLNYYNFMKKKGIDIRKKIDFFYWLLLCSLLSALLFAGLGHQHYIFAAISLSLFMSMAVLLVRNVFLVELIHFLVIIGVFYYQFQ